jgi:acyl dehydratase
MPDTGARLPSPAVSGFTFPVEAGHVLLFARALGDPNPAYADPGVAADGLAGGLVAPPTFTMAADHFEPGYSRRPQPGVPWFGSGALASGVDGDGAASTHGFHAEQRFTYHRHVRPGDVLAVQTRPGERWERDGRRGGRMRFSEQITEYVDPTGSTAVTAVWVSCLVEHLTTGPAREPDPEPGTITAVASGPTVPAQAPLPIVAGRGPLRLGEVAVGDRFDQVVVDDLTRTQIVQYAGASGDFHPLHHDEVHARHRGYPGIFAHGMLTMGVTGRALTDLVGDARLLGFGARFTAPVWPGDVLRTEIEVREIDATAIEPTVDLALRTTNQHGDRVLDATATARLDR